MKIGIVVPPLLKTPPSGYGGLEQVAYDLCCALAAKGEEVTLIAPVGSHAEGCKVFETIQSPEKTDVNWIQLEYDAFMKYQSILTEFDIIHDHSWFAFPYLVRFDEKNRGLKICHTHHGHLDWNVKATKPEILPVNLIGISSYMSSEYKTQGWESKFVYNGINLQAYKAPSNVKREKRAVFVGRISPIKQPDQAYAHVWKQESRLMLSADHLLHQQKSRTSTLSENSVKKAADLQPSIWIARRKKKQRWWRAQWCLSFLRHLRNRSDL